jgi:hypothetical protein
MNLNKLNLLPEWNDEKMNRFKTEEGDEWKTKPAMEIGKALYNQWREIFGLVYAFTDSLIEEESEKSHPASTKNLIFQNLMIVAPKLLSAIRVNDYVLKMENAAIIRHNCKEMMVQISFSAMMGNADEQYKEVIESAMDNFRELFKQWIMTFEKDDFNDEWGLFN